MAIIASSAIYGRMARDAFARGKPDRTGYTTTVTDEILRRWMAKLYWIEKFVEDVLANETPAFKIKKNPSGQAVLEELPLAAYFRLVVDFSFQYTLDHQCSARVELFFECWTTLNLKDEGFRKYRGYSSKPGQEPFEVFNELIALIRLQAKTPAFRRKLVKRRNTGTRNYRSADKYITGLFKSHAVLEVVRLKFYYRDAHAIDFIAGQAASHVKAKADFERFFNNRRGKLNLFADCVGYIWTMQPGPGKDWHFNVIFFFSESTVSDASCRASRIGHYWTTKITAGRGVFSYRLASELEAPKSESEKIGKRDKEGRNRLLAEVRYQTGIDQYLRAIEIGKHRCFGKGAALHKKMTKPKSQKVR